MVKQKVQKSWLQKTKSQRHAKSLTDARLLSKPSRAKTSYSEYVCSICETKGSLLACISCLKLYHLSCLDLSPLQIPLSQWPCPECSFDHNFSFLEALESFVDDQRQEKELKLKKLVKKINKAKPNTKLRDFEVKYPELVRAGVIQYPIDDGLLWSKPKLHEVSFQRFPIEHSFAVPVGLVTDLMFVCDFCSCFQSILATPSLKCETLYTVLQTTQETELSRSLHLSLLRPLIIILLKSEGYRKKGPILNYLTYKIKKLIGFDKLLKHSYLTFVENFFDTDVWKDLIEEIDKESWQVFQNFSFVNNFYNLPAEYKLKLLVLFIGMLLETKLINEECNKRHEAQQKLLKEQTDLISLTKNKKGIVFDKEEVERRMKEIKTELKKLPTRTLCLGADRAFREYFFFPWDTSKLLIRTSDPLREHCTWTFYDKKSELQQFVQCLSSKGTRESSLLIELSEILNTNDFRTTEIETTSSDTEEERNKYKEPVQSFYILKTWLKDLHNSIAEALRLEANQKFVQTVEDSDADGIAILLLEFHLAFVEQDTGENPVCRKVKNLWENCDLYMAWEGSVKEIKNVSESFLCVHFLALTVERFVKENRVVVKEFAKNEARRSYRLERLSRIKKVVLKEQDVNCYICGLLGLVACCDRCPKVAHLECLGVEDLPEGEWICPVCTEKANNVRVTRSKQIKY